MHIGFYIREARRLAKEAQADPNVTPNNLVLRNLAIPVYTARDAISKTRFDYRGHIFEELVAVGNFALVRAAHAFDQDLAKRDPGAFTPYAMTAVERAQWDAIEDLQSGAVDAGKYGRELLPRIRGAVSRRLEDGEIDPADIAKELGIAESTVRQLLAIADGVDSLDRSVDNEPDLNLISIIPDRGPGPEEEVLAAAEAEERFAVFQEALQSLNEDMRVAIGLNTGFPAFDRATIATLLYAHRQGNQQTARRRLIRTFRGSESYAARLGFQAKDATGQGPGNSPITPAPRGQERARLKRDSPADIWRRLTDRWREEAGLVSRQTV